MFTATGTRDRSGTSNRTLRGTYVVHTTNANISGGLVHVYRGSATLNDLCIDAGSGNPAAGTAVTMQLCNAGAVAQTWAYDGNLRLQLVSSPGPGQLTGLCLDAGATHAVNSRGRAAALPDDHARPLPAAVEHQRQLEPGRQQHAPAPTSTASASTWPAPTPPAAH